MVHNSAWFVLMMLIYWAEAYMVGFNISQATKALRKSRGIAVLYFRPLH